MSIVCAVRKSNEVAIASDTMTSSGSTRIGGQYIQGPEKIYEVGGSYVGFVGWSAMEIIFEDLTTNGTELFDFSNRLSIFRSLLKLQEVLKEKYFIKTDEDERGQPVESSQIDALVINENGVFKIGSFREVDELTRFWAIGSGRSFALGAMYALYDDDLTAEQIARRGAEAAAEFNDSCGLPITSAALVLKS